MLELYLIRHPETLGGEILKGHLDAGLKPGWETQVDAIAAELANRGPFDAFFSSNLQRARLPAERIATYLRSRQKMPLEIVSTKLLIERDVGILQGKKYGEIDTKGKKLNDYIFEEEHIPEGESKSDTIKRVETFARECLQRHIDSGGNVGMVGHGWWINYLINSLLHESRPFNQMKNLEMIQLSIGGKIAKEK